MNLAELPADCRSFVTAEAKVRNMTEQAVLDYFDRLIDEVDAEIENIGRIANA